MPPSPPKPVADARPPLRAALDEARFFRDAATEGILFFCVEGAPPEACATRSGPGGVLVFHTSLRGRVLAVEPDLLVLAAGRHRVHVRHHLPPGVELAPLAGRRVALTLTQSYRGRGRATIDAVLADDEGHTFLWAHDGRHPDDAHGLSLRAMLEGGATRLAVRTDAGAVAVPCPGVASIALEGREHALVVVRGAADDVGFVLLRR
ncbi:MAG: hypothetical protein KF729_06975 [Sandaracinaceae bacterium]|nr:hypothetical protein [Sandaracinaceae bacterium]